MIQKQKLKKYFGNEYNTFLFRFPGGSYGGVYNKIKKQIKTVLREKGIASLDWNALTGDAEGKNATPETAREIIKRLKAEGYVFKNFYEIFQ